MIRPFSSWLAATSLSATLQQAAWAIPLLQTIHILCIAIVFSSICLISARLAGFNRQTGMQEVLRSNLRIFWPATGILFVTGSLLVISEPGRDLLNPMFWTKMTLLILGLFVVVTQKILTAKERPLESVGRANTRLHVSIACIQILVWVSVISCGRWIAYFDAGAN